MNVEKKACERLGVYTGLYGIETEWQLIWIFHVVSYTLTFLCIPHCRVHIYVVNFVPNLLDFQQHHSDCLVSPYNPPQSFHD